MPALHDCVLLHGPDLQPHHCARFAWRNDTITEIELGEPCSSLDAGARVVIPGLTNGHTHIGDCALPDGATGLTLEEGFFRPQGYKYRELAKLTPLTHLPHIIAHHRFMARCGTVRHIDFREQGVDGAELLREASAISDVQSIVLSQFTQSPFDADTLAENRAALTETARAELAAMLVLSDGFSESTMNDLTDLGWSEVREATRAAGKLRAIHCLENAGYRDTSRLNTGKGDLVRALEIYDADLVVHLTAANPQEIALLARSKRTAAINPRANATLGLPLPPVAALMKSGVPLLLGTDNVMLNPPNLFAEMDFTYKLARSQFGDATRPDPVQILRMVTTNIRPLLGHDFFGYLERGLPADFVVLDFHQPHLRATRNLLASIVTRVTPADVLATYRYGRVLWRDAQWED